MWNLPRPGIKPVCPALAEGFLTNGPAGKSDVVFYSKKYVFSLYPISGTELLKALVLSEWWEQWEHLLLQYLVFDFWNHFRAIEVNIIVVVQSLSHVWLFAAPWTVAHQASLSFTISWSLHKLMSVESGMPSNHLILCHPLLLLPSIFPSIRVFPNELTLHIRWPK